MSEMHFNVKSDAVCNAATLAAVVEAPRLHNDNGENRRQGAGGTAGEGAGVTKNSSAYNDASGTKSQLRFGTVEIRDRGRLPHWESEGATYFVTFRLADSLPAPMLKQLKNEREMIERQAIKNEGKLTHHQQARIKALMSEHLDQYLDFGAGECHLKNPQVAQVVTETLTLFERRDYRLIAWCIMPNHVHVIIRPYPGIKLSNIMHSWKSFTAKKANKVVGKRGSFWQREYYDHIIRNEDEYRRTIEYVLTNPERAGLKNWKWVGFRKG